MKFKKVEDLTGVSRTTIKKWLETDLDINLEKTNSGAHLFRWPDVFKIHQYSQFSGKNFSECKVITIANNKGGVGKTTSTHNIALGLSYIGKTLMIDLDGQSNLTQLFDINPSGTTKSIIDLFQGADFSTVVHQISHGLDIVPSHIRFDKWKKSNQGQIQSALLLKRRLKEIKKNYDFIIIDTPPALDLSLDQALYASDYCIISLQAEYLAVEGMHNLIETIEEIKKDTDIVDFNLKTIGIFLTMYEHHKALSKTLASAVYNEYGDLLFDAMVRRSESIKQAQAGKVSTYEFDESCSGAEDYFEITTELLKRIHNDEKVA